MLLRRAVPALLYRFADLILLAKTDLREITVSLTRIHTHTEIRGGRLGGIRRRLHTRDTRTHTLKHTHTQIEIYMELLQMRIHTHTHRQHSHTLTHTKEQYIGIT